MVGYCNWNMDVDRNWKDFDHYREQSTDEEQNDEQVSADWLHQIAGCTAHPPFGIHHVDHLMLGKYEYHEKLPSMNPRGQMKVLLNQDTYAECLHLCYRSRKDELAKFEKDR